MKIDRIRRKDVEFMPATLAPGILYVSKKYKTAAHLCACGCGEKVRTQLGDMGWRLLIGRSGPSLRPSIGNWQKPCRSHYFITNGRILWEIEWTEQEVLEGRAAEYRRRDAYLQSRQKNWWLRLKALLGRW